MAHGDAVAIIFVFVAITFAIVLALARGGKGPGPVPPPPPPDKVPTVQQRLAVRPGMAERVSIALMLMMFAVPGALAAGLGERLALRLVGALWMAATIGVVIAGITGWFDRESAVQRRHARELARSEAFWSQPDAQRRFEQAKRAHEDATIAVALFGHPALRRRVLAERRRPRR